MSMTGQRSNGEPWRLVLDISEFPATIEKDHAANLRVYFRNAGLGVFDRSTLGGQLERTELYAKPARPCVACGGTPSSGRPGTGFVPPEWAAELSKQRRKQSLSNEQSLLVRLIDFGESCGDTSLASTETCGKCGGCGWVPGKWPVAGAQTARPTGSSKHGSGGVSVSDAAMHAIAVVSARLSLAMRLFALCEPVLEAYYGPDGGGLVDIWPITQAGKTLLKRNKLKVDALRFLANERASQQESPDRNRRKLFDACDEQSQAMLDASGQAWNAACVLSKRVAAHE